MTSFDARIYWILFIHCDNSTDINVSRLYLFESFAFVRLGNYGDHYIGKEIRK